MPIRLNLGAGDTKIEGFIPIDRKLGSEVYPLPQYADGSVDEIRASHILEHATYAQAKDWLGEWVRVLKPGGSIRIAVPDAQKALSELVGNNDEWRFHLMGGQTTDDDFHRSAWAEPVLRGFMTEAGIGNIQPWVSENTDCASNPVSLNLCGVKGDAAKPQEPLKVRMCALMSIPRVGWNDSWGCIFETLFPFKVPIRRCEGVYWGQGMQRLMEDCLTDGLDWIITLDYDTLCTAKHLSRMFDLMAKKPEIDALAAMQCRRGQYFPLMTYNGKKRIKLENNDPIPVSSAHFGMTILRTECLKNMPKPWFAGKPDGKGEWGPARMDDDIWFWHQWKAAGHSIYVAPDVRIGHLEAMVAMYDDNLKPKHIRIGDWREQNGHRSKRWE